MTLIAFILFSFPQSWRTAILDANPVTEIDSAGRLFLVFSRDAIPHKNIPVDVLLFWKNPDGNFNFHILHCHNAALNRRRMVWPFIGMLALCEGAVWCSSGRSLQDRVPAGVIPAYIRKITSFPSGHSALCQCCFTASYAISWCACN